MASRSASGSTKDRKKTGSSTGNSGPKKSTAKKKAKKRTTKKAAKKWTSRAVVRLIEAGSTAECPQCEERVKFRARHRDQQVICNVYVRGVWDRVEQYHLECYDKAGKPHGKAITK